MGQTSVDRQRLRCSSMRCGVLRVAVRRVLVLVSAVALIPAVLLLIGSSVTRHRYQIDGFYGTWGPGPDPGWMSRMAIRMAARRAELRDACIRTGLDVPSNDSLHQPNPWEYLINTQHHLVWCNVFKAASTSWMYNFNILAGYTPHFLKQSKVVPLQLARQRYPRPSLETLRDALNSSISFLIVRHPLERLLSAYRDKIQYSLPHTLHQRLGIRIIQKYRTKSRSTIGSRDPTKRKRLSPKWPTFSEFVQYLLDEFREGREFDMHWAPIAEFCTPCHLHFEVIAKFETLEEDQNYLIYRARLQDYIHPEWKNPAKGRTATTNLISSYYTQLTKKEILSLYEIYRYDFELFGYTLDGYLEQGEEDPTSPPSASRHHFNKHQVTKSPPT
ncbi:carbohydrate sulfotransferase 11 isoform X2 [Thrips palmi]|uniref:Carbohydrate sulfotransferase n=1 Tax=Thrips palmi TaxID=161013 RepID=A0A6P8ZCN6_THRPL|nr:carbohydrate sulfotransferase 11 isoform X2 [Thrips palmi]